MQRWVDTLAPIEGDPRRAVSGKGNCRPEQPPEGSSRKSVEGADSYVTDLFGAAVAVEDPVWVREEDTELENDSNSVVNG